MKRLGRRGLIGALACVALVLAGAASALADFPYTPGAGTNAHDYSTYHTDAGQAPNDFGDDWRLAATPENSAQSISSDNWKPTELCGIRGASVVDNSATYSSLLWPPSPMTSCQSLGGQPVHTAWQTTTGRPDVAIAVLDSGILWNDAGKMVDLRNKVRLNTGELPLPEVAATSTDSSLASSCAGYDKAGNGGATDPNTGAHTSSKYDANDDGIVNLADYACDPRVHVASGPTSPRHGPNGTMTPEDLIIAFGNCQIDSSTHLILGCTPGQHFDNDHNAFANDIAGWDFVDNKNNPYDDVQYGHGSGEARDSTAEANNGQSVGTCPNCMVLPLRVGESFIADVNRFAQAVLYATDTQPQPGGQQSGVYVVQEALGTLNNSTLARDALAYAYNHGVAVIASAADEAAEHHNQPGSLADTIVVNSANQYDDVPPNGLGTSPQPRSYLQFNGCTNFTTHLIVSVPSSSCSSNATGNAGGMAGLIYSEALNAIHAGTINPNAKCHRVNGSQCPLTANEVRQLMGSGNLGGAAPADQGGGQADDVNFAAQPEPGCHPSPTPPCTDPNNNTSFDTTEQNGGHVVSPAATTHRYHARLGFDEFYGYGRIDAYKDMSAVAAGKIPPEAEITSPDWFEQLDPTSATINIDGRVDARPPSGSSTPAPYTCVVEVAPGGEPNNASSSSPPGDFHPVPSSYCDGSTAHSGPFTGTLGTIDVATLKSYFASASVGSFNGREPGLAGGQTSNGRPNTMPYAFTVRVVVATTGGSPMSGEDRRQFFLHRDADTLNSHWPVDLHTDGASTPTLVDLDGDNRNELIVATSDGVIHAFRPDGTELPGWPVHTDPMALHTGEVAYSTSGGPVTAPRYGAILGSLGAGDLFHNGRIEIVADDNEGKVYAWDSSGNLIFKQEANPAFSGNPVFPGSDPLKEYFSVRQGNRHRVEHGFVTAPVLAHLDGNPTGRLDIIVAGEDRHLYAWQPDPSNVSGSAVPGFPVPIVDPDKIDPVTPFNPVTHAVNFNPATAGPDEGNKTMQGKLVDTPAVADIDGSGKPEIIVGSNEEYHPGSGDEPQFNAGNFNTVTLTSIGMTGALGSGNTRIYAVKSTGLPAGDTNLAHAFLPGWPFKVGILERSLLPDVGEGLTGSPVVGPVNCPSGPGSGSVAPHIGLIPDAGPAYILNNDGTSCYGNDPSNGRPKALQSDFSPNTTSSDTPAIPAVGDPAFGNLGGQVTFLAPTSGLTRALDVAVNEYQGGQDYLAAWNPSTGNLLSGWPSPLNDLQFLTGPGVGVVGQSNTNEAAVEGSASLDLAALGADGSSIGPNWPKLTGDWTVATPVLGSFGTLDTDHSATKDVVSITRYGVLTVYSTPASACSPSSWPRFHHDIANSGDYARIATPPGKPMNASVSKGTLTFTAPGAQLMCGTANHFEVVTSDSPITPENFASAIPIAGVPAPSAPGSAESITLPAGTRRYVAVRAGQSLPDPEQGNVGLPAVVDTASPAPGGGNGGAGPLVSPSSPGSVLGAGAGGAGGGPVGVTPGAIAPLGPSLGLPSNGSCLSHRHLTVHLTPPAAETLVSARVFVNGKRVRVLRGRRLHARVDLGGLPRGAFTVKIVAHTDTGHTIRARRTYHTCAHKARRRRGRRR